jgi:hypothetical protein
MALFVKVYFSSHTLTYIKYKKESSIKLKSMRQNTVVDYS